MGQFALWESEAQWQHAVGGAVKDMFYEMSLAFSKDVLVLARVDEARYTAMRLLEQGRKELFHDRREFMMEVALRAGSVSYTHLTLPTKRIV